MQDFERLQDGETSINANGIAHWGRIAGSHHRTTPLLIIHGGPGGNHYVFERTIGPRLEAFAPVIYYEQRGSGRSAAPAEPDAYSLPLLVSDLEALRTALGLNRFIPLGYSFGGELALEYTLAHQDRVARLIVQAPSGTANPVYQAYVQLEGFETVAEGKLKQQIRSIRSGGETSQEQLAQVWNTVDSATVDRFLFQNQEIARYNRNLWRESGIINTGQMARALQKQPKRDPSLRQRLSEIHLPALVIIGLYDRNTGVDSARNLAATLPQGKLALFEQSAHFPDLEEPEKYARTVRTFVEQGENGS